MFCFIYKWMVSRSHDRGKSLSGLAVRHMDRCSECRDFARFSQSLSAGLRRDAQEFLRGGDNSLDEKITAALTAEHMPQRIPRRRCLPAPALAAALAIILVATALLFKVIPEKTPGNPFTVGLPGPIDTTNVLQDIVGRVESPIEKEMRSLEQSVKSAVQSLLSGLDPKITG